MGLAVERAGEQPSLPVGEHSQPAEDRADLLAPEDDRDGVRERVGVLSDRIDQPAFGVLDWCGGLVDREDVGEAFAVVGAGGI